MRLQFTPISDVMFQFTPISDVRFQFIPISDVRFRFGRITDVRFRVTDVGFELQMLGFGRKKSVYCETSHL